MQFLCVSKMAHVMMTITTVTTKETTRFFRYHIHKLHDIPLEIINDRDARFMDRFWQELYYLLSTQLAMSTSSHCQSDDQT